MTVSQAQAQAAERLLAAGISDAERDAETLLLEVLRWDLASLLTRGREPLDASAFERLHELVGRRAAREPLQHILGVAHFWRHKLLISNAALVPRPETETLVETALDLLAELESPTLVDVGTGSGCIALSLAAERPDAAVHATDLSPAALELARQNARLLGVTARVHFHEGDLLQPLRALAGRIDLIASNPPYLDAHELGSLEPEVRDREPRMALVPPDGERYSIYRRLVPQAAELLRREGALLLEVGLGMAEEVSRLCASAGLRVERVVPDLQQIPRVVVARR